MQSIHRLVLSAMAVGFILAQTALADDEEAVRTGWSDTAELSLLATGGNSDAQTLAFRNALARRWDRSSLTITAAAVRAETTTTSRVAVGTAASFDVLESASTALTAENYLLRGRYDREISERLFWLAGLGWDRNQFAGVENRVNASAGLGTLWFEREDARFKTDYSLTFTDEEDVSGSSESFAGIRVSYDYLRKLTATTDFGSQLVLDENLDDTADLRADLVNSLSVAMSDRLALKVSLQLLYDREPALGALPLLDPTGSPTGETVLAELEELDTALTVSLVANF